MAGLVKEGLLKIDLHRISILQFAAALQIAPKFEAVILHFLSEYQSLHSDCLLVVFSYKN